MPIGIGTGLPFVAMSPGQSIHLLNDTFTTDRAVGSVNGSAAEPGPGVRQGVDAASKLTISGGRAVLQPNAVYNPRLFYGPYTRIPGRLAIFVIRHDTPDYYYFGWDDNFGSNPKEGFRIRSSGMLYRATVDLGASPANNVDTAYIIVLRSTGSQVFKVVGGVPWLVWIDEVNAQTPLYPFAGAGVGSTASYDLLNVPAALWLANPVISDGFASSFGATDGLAHLEGIAGGLGAGGSGAAWTQAVGTWTVTSAKAQATALSGGQAIATVPVPHADVLVGLDIVRNGGASGGVARYTDPSNCLRFYQGGSNLTLDQIVAGTPTTLITAAAAASGRAWLDLFGTSARLYYNNVLIGSTASINAGLTAAVVGLRTTDLTNTMDNLVVYPKGTGNEYIQLLDFF